MAMKAVVEGTNEGTNITDSQVSELYRVAALPGSHINRATLQAVIEGRNPFEENPIAEAVKKFVGILAFVTVATVPAITTRMSPNEAFRNCPFLQLYNSVLYPTLSEFQPITSAPETKYVVSRTVSLAPYSMIRTELPYRHLAEWYHIISLIGKQSNGEAGVLLTKNRDANIFFMRGVGRGAFVVAVCWNPGYPNTAGRWMVYTWKLDESSLWPANAQVLFPINAAV